MIQYVPRGSSTAPDTPRADWLGGISSGAAPIAGAAFNPALGRYDTSNYVGKLGANAPELSYFGISDAGKEMAALYNDFYGYGQTDVRSNGDAGEILDTSVSIDPWTGAVRREYDPFGLRPRTMNVMDQRDALLSGQASGVAAPGAYSDLALPDQTQLEQVRALVESTRSMTPAERNRALLAPEAQQLLGQFVPRGVEYDDREGGGELDQKGKILKYFGDPRSNYWDSFEAEYLPKLEQFNDAKSRYESEQEKFKEAYLSPKIDTQLRELFKDDEGFKNSITQNKDYFVNTLNYALKGRGVEDLQSLAWTEQDGQTVFYNAATGQEVVRDQESLITYPAPNGGYLSIRLKPMENGQVSFDTHMKQASKWGGGNWVGTLAPIAMGVLTGGALAGVLTPALTPTLGAIGGKVAGGAIAGGVTSAALGGDFTKGLLGGAIAPATGMLGSAVSSAVGGGIAGKVIGGMASGAAGAAIMGGDIEGGLLGGLVGGVMPSPTSSKSATTQAQDTTLASKYQLKPAANTPITTQLFGARP